MKENEILYGILSIDPHESTGRILFRLKKVSSMFVVDEILDISQDDGMIKNKKLTIRNKTSFEKGISFYKGLTIINPKIAAALIEFILPDNGNIDPGNVSQHQGSDWNCNYFISTDDDSAKLLYELGEF